jgi:cytoskeletal protein RodZ
LEENEVLDRFNQFAASFYHEKAEEIRTDQQKQDEKKESAKRKQAIIQWGVSVAVLMMALGLFILNVSEHRERQLPAGTEESAQKSENSERSNEVLPLNLPKGQIEPSTGVPPTSQSTNQPRPILSVNPPTSSVQASIPSDQRFAATNKEPSSPVSSPASKESALPELLTLRIEAIERSWVLVKIDSDVTKEVLLNPGEKVDWSAHQQFRLSLGNAGGVRVVFNGKPLDPLGPSGAVVKDLILPKE